MSTTLEEKQSEAPVGLIDYRVSAIEKKLDDMSQDIRDIRTNIYNMDTRLNSKIDLKIDQVNSKMDSNFKWLIGTYIAFSSMILAAFYAFATYLKP